ncbi:hypothetical protein AMIS_51670 [Actinoplanes missouriensis 431]|uniref:NACHT domain-containing protein n=1 Tax=Actinoplanes missouriensis (strain ATCC 14538 / DSM 43046 / CBS 188.64 / JCM 3121 / NBRC 102363 / NCIMB 12654 / NRRL B-3342 / UNCC 431) TaxID=512565 RepID=I0HBK0_ACTM4|nr:hypothetical protein AMIS_51670 [Actinoplanes missouriensis 431]
MSRDWSAEAVRREITRPDPLLVSWSSTGRPAASRNAVLGATTGGDWQQFPLRGSTDSLNEEILAAFRGLRHRQLIVLGAPGAGKSGFAVLLTLALSGTRETSEPVPVLLAISEWDPTEPVDAFISRRVSEDYAAVLAHHGEPRVLAARLLEHGLIFPVLDGLDELAAGASGTALEALDVYAAGRRPLVVTCRAHEYEQAVIRSETVLITAAVVELDPVTMDAAVRFLSYPEMARTRWEPVFTHLRDQPDGPLAATLSTPLMVALARTAYREAGTDPAELLELPDREAVSGRLMDAYVTSLYPGRGRRWLGTLAYHLYLRGTRDLHWWQIPAGILAARQRLTQLGTVAAGALLVGSCTAVAGGGGPGFVTGIVAVLLAARGWLRPLWPHDGRPYLPARFLTTQQRALRTAGLGLGYTFGCATAVAAMTGYWTASLLGGLVSMPATAGFWMRAPVESSSRHGWRAVAGVAAPIALLSGVSYATVAVLTDAAALSLGVRAALVHGGTVVLVSSGWVWLRFRLTHLRLAVIGRLPWRLNAFLNEAYRHGVLRKAGPAYQFRHALLQDHLAQATRVEHLATRTGTGDRAVVGHVPSPPKERTMPDHEGGDYTPDSAFATRPPLGPEVPPEIRLRMDERDRLSALIDSGRLSEAFESLPPDFSSPDHSLIGHLIERLIASGMTHRANRILEIWAANGDKDAQQRLAENLYDQGRIDELRRRAFLGERAAALRVISRILAEDSTEVAMRFARQLTAIPDLYPVLAAEFGDLEPLKAWFRAGSNEATEALAFWLEIQGDIDDAVDLLRTRTSGGDRWAADILADLLARHDRTAEAIQVLRPWVDAGHRNEARHTADLLAGQGDYDEAVRLLRARADAGSEFAKVDVMAYRSKVHPDEHQIDRLREAVSLGLRLKPFEARRLARLLVRRGRIREAVSYLRANTDNHERWVVHLLAWLTDQVNKRLPHDG